MFDPKAPSSQRVFAELEKEAVRAQLHRYALWRTGNEDDAKDLVADAIVLACDPDKRKPWDPDARTLFSHMRRVMDDVAIAGARIGRGRFKINETRLVHQTGDADAFPDAADGRDPTDEQLAAHRELAWLRELGARLLERLRGKDEKAIAVFHAACVHEEPAEQAKALGIPVAEVYEAHRRLRYRGLIIKAEWHKAEAERMAEARRPQPSQRKEPPS